MGPKSKRLVAEGQLALVDELRLQRALLQRIDTKLDELKASGDDALTELELRVFNLEGARNGAPK